MKYDIDGLHYWLPTITGKTRTLWKDSPSPPPAPDYAGAAQATAAGNLDAARAASSANKVNQVTPYGNLTYSINGKDSYGNDLYTATQTLSPEQQKLLNQNTALSSGLLDTAQTGLNYANTALAKPGVDLSSLPSTGINPGQSYQDAMMAQLQPQIDRSNQQLDTQLANQGIGLGSDAYNNAKQIQAQTNNNLLAQATTSGMGMGLNANNQAFNQQAYNQMQPINVINALRSGTQVSNPNFVNTPQQATTQGADLLSAAQNKNNYNMGIYNSGVGQANSFNSGLMGLAGAGISAAPYFM